MSTLLEQKYNSCFHIHNDTNEKQQVLYPTTSLPPNQKTSGTTRRLTTSKDLSPWNASECAVTPYWRLDWVSQSALESIQPFWSG